MLHLFRELGSLYLSLSLSFSLSLSLSLSLSSLAKSVSACHHESSRLRNVFQACRLSARRLQIAQPMPGRAVRFFMVRVYAEVSDDKGLTMVVVEVLPKKDSGASLRGS